MGSAAAAAAAHDLIGSGATSLVSWGMAGGLDPTLKPGTILLPAEITDSAGHLLPTTQSWRERLGIALASHQPSCGGKLLTMDSVIDSPALKAECFRATRASAVDMESFAVSQVAATHSLPFLAVRVIVDGADDVLPRFVLDAVVGREGPAAWRIISSLIRAPAQLASLLRLTRRYRAASRSLTAIARSNSLLARAEQHHPQART